MFSTQAMMTNTYVKIIPTRIILYMILYMKNSPFWKENYLFFNLGGADISYLFLYFLYKELDGYCWVIIWILHDLMFYVC